ncbi:DUF427 domain-containing protein [Streptacidiphilus carbonis]|uniref:DUF427 domain-containing protein n=1 Tax=Streptacidiphilus carbonis TaxID=105422 RepID=UPI0005AADE4A|nr:DUF427 domain-containing protein [Streptacidiphilus carbonis]
MTDRPVLQPSASHPITVSANPARVVVTVAGRTVADTRNALILREAQYPAVQYIPRADVDLALLEPSDNESYCPFKGEATYYSIPVGGERSVDSVWVYESPYPAVAEIKGHVAFYPDRVDSITEQSE